MSDHRPGRLLALFMNPTAGKGNAQRWLPLVEAYLQGERIAYDLFRLDYPETLDAYTDVLILGGDGTVNHVLNHFPNLRLPIGVIPGGTGNDLAIELDQGHDIERCLRTAVHGTAGWVDAGSCNGKLFMNCFGVGFDGEVANAIGRVRWLEGSAKYYWTVLRQIFSYRPVHMKVQWDGGCYEKKALTVMVANSQWSGGGFKVAPMAALRDGKLDVVILDGIPVWKRLFYLPRIRKGGHASLGFVHHARVSRVEIKTPAPVQAHMDGELMREDRFTVEVQPGQFLFRMADAPDRSPKPEAVSGQGSLPA